MSNPRNSTAQGKGAQAVDGASVASQTSRTNLVFGWRMLLMYLILGMALEGLHGFKIGWYLSVANETRRLLWTLAHAHGTLLSLINIGFALTLRSAAESAAGSCVLASRCLIGATVLLPAGFFFGGVFIYGGDPGLAILLVPFGAVLLLVGVLLAGNMAALSRS